MSGGAGDKCPFALVTFLTTMTEYRTTATRGRKCSAWFSVPGDTGQHGEGMQASQVLVCGRHAGITHELMVMISTYRADCAGCQAEGQSPYHAFRWVSTPSQVEKHACSSIQFNPKVVTEGVR